MKLFLFLICFLFSFEASSKNLQKDFEKLRKNNYSKNLVLENNHFYFSQISFPWEKNSNRKKLSRIGTIQSINEFKKKYIKKHYAENDSNLYEYGLEFYLNKKISIKNARKIEDRRYKTHYLVVMAIPKNDIKLNSVQKLDLSEIITFNSKNHHLIPKDDREKFFKKLKLKDLLLLWKLKEMKTKFNLANYISKVNPIKYQMKIDKILIQDNYDIKFLNEIPSFKKIVIEHLNKNKNLNYLSKLSFKSSICAHNNDFLKTLTKNNFFVVNGRILYNENSFLNLTLSRCNGFISFEKNINKNIKKELSQIKKMFESGKNLDGIIVKIEDTFEKNPNNFELWNYYSACLRAKKNHKRALVASRVELSIALEIDSVKHYNEALKSYSKAVINHFDKLNKNQKIFYKTFL